MKNFFSKIIYGAVAASLIACLFVYSNKFKNSFSVDLGGGAPVLGYEPDVADLDIGDFPDVELPDPKFPELGGGEDDPDTPVPKDLIDAAEYSYFDAAGKISVVFDTADKKVTFSSDTLNDSLILKGEFTAVNGSSIKISLTINNESKIVFTAQVLYNSVVTSSFELMEIFGINDPFSQGRIVFSL
jgi:hypothetical protein